MGHFGWQSESLALTAVDDLLGAKFSKQWQVRHVFLAAKK
jgi:hypothetical protein